MKKQQKKIHVYEFGRNEWERKMKTICHYANEVGYQYGLLEVDQFTPDLLPHLNETFLRAKVEEKIKAENLPTSLLSLARQQHEQQLTYVLRAIDGLQKAIFKAWDDSRYLTNPECLAIENIPFSGNHAEVTEEAGKAITDKYFTNTISTPFELDLYSKVELAAAAINDVLSTAREQIRVHYITDFITFDNVTGEAEVKTAEFGDFKYL